MLARFGVIFLALTGMITFFACMPQTVVREGVRMTVHEAASLDFNEAQELYAQGKKEAAITALKGILKTYPHSDLSDKIHSKLGDIYLSSGRLEEASLHYRSVVEDYRSSPLRSRAQLRLGVCAFRLERFEEASRHLAAVANRFTEPVERLEVYALLTQSYERAGKEMESVPYYVSMVRVYDSHQLGESLQTPFTKIPPRETCHERTITILTHATDQSALRSIISEYGSSFPAQFALLRLGQLQINEQKWSLAEANLEELLRRFPSDPLSQDGRRILRQVQSRYVVNENRVGVILPLSGRFAGLGQLTLHGMELAVALSKDQFPHAQTEFVIRDTKGDAEVAAKAVSDLVTEENVIAIIGSIGSDSGRAAKEAQSIGVPILSLSSAQDLADIGPFVFQNALSPQREVQSLIAYANHHPLPDPQVHGRFAILYPKSEYGLRMRDIFWDEVLAQGGEVVGCESYTPRQTDFKKEVSKLVGLYDVEPRREAWDYARRKAREKKQPLRDVRPEPIVDFSGLFVPDSYRTASMIADHLPLYDVENVWLLGNNGWNDPGLPLRSPHLQTAIFTDSFHTQSSRPETQTFLMNYRTTFQESPHRLSAYGFDSVMILMTLLASPKNQNRDALQQALTQLRDFDGVTGTMSFRENGAADNLPVLLTVSGKEIVEAKN